MKPYRAIFSFIVISTVLTSCLKDDLKDLQTDSWEPEIALPLIFASYDGESIIGEFESDGLITTNSENTITLLYRGELFKLSALDLFEFPNVPYVFTDTLIGISVDNLTNAKLQKLEVNSGEITYDIELNYLRDVLVELIIPAATKNGLPFKEEILIEYAGNSNMSKSGSISLNNAEFDFSGPGGNGFNNFEMHYVAKEVRSSKNVDIALFKGEFKDISYGLVTGNFEKLVYSLEDEQIKVDIFENFKSGKVIIEEPRIHLQFVNSFGIPVGTDIRSFRGIKDGNSFPLTGSIFDKKINIGFPALSTNKEEIVVNEYINSENSDIKNFISLTPGVLDYSLDFEISSENTANEVNYVKDSSEFRAIVELEIPFYTTLEFVTIRDTFDITFEEVKNARNISFKLLVDNSFPINAGIQLTFIDEFSNELDSLLPHNKKIFRSGAPNANGVVEKSLLTETYFEMDELRFEKIKDSKQIVMTMELVTAGEGQQSVKFLNSNALSMKLGVRAKLKDL